MEWVETTGRTTEEAKDHALDQLGVDESDAEFEILEEPRPGLFGRGIGAAARTSPARPTPQRRAPTARTDRPLPKVPRVPLPRRLPDASRRPRVPVR